MARILRAGIWLVVVMACVAGALVVRRARPAESDFARWFIPGSVGIESGASGPPDYLPSGTPDPRSSGPPDLRPSGTSPQRGFLTRDLSLQGGAESQQWARDNNLTKPLAFSHNLGAIFPPSLFAEHPEFFPLADGKRLDPPKGSYFWNPDIARPDVAKYAAAAARKYFETHPDEVSFPLGVNDALIWGESPELLALATPTKWFRDRPDYSPVVFTFMNRVAEQLEQTHPDKYVGALAYYWAENTPAFPLHRQVVPFLTADRGQGYDAGFRKEELELQAKWGRAGGAEVRSAGVPEVRGAGRSEVQSSGGPEGKVFQPGEPDLRTSGPPLARRLGMYDYLYGGGFLIPRIHTQLLAENLRQARSVGFTDYYAEVYPNWGLDGPMPWLTAQLLQDPEQSEAALLDEYYRRYFKDAAAPMRRFFERCEEQWMNQPGPPYWLKHYRNESQAIIFPTAVCRELRALLEEARHRAGSGKVRQRVELTRVAFGVTERFVAFQEARDSITRTALQGESAAKIESELVIYLGARREFIRYTSEVRRTVPLALHPFRWDDYLHNDPVPLALLALGVAQRTGGSEDRSAGRPEVQRTGVPEGLSFGVPEERRTGSSGAAALNPGLAAEPRVAALWPAIISAFRPALRTSGPPAFRTSGTPGRRPSGPLLNKELLRDPQMTGEAKPGRTIAGLPYGVSLPADWTSQVEPAEFHRAELVGGGENRVLRISGSKDTRLSQWTQVGGGGLHEGEIRLRGRVSTSVVVRLVFSWLDEKHQHVGWTGVRLPEGEWPEWVSLKQAGLPPKGAAWVGLGLRVQNQVPGDWVEAKGFSLRSAE